MAFSLDEVVNLLSALVRDGSGWLIAFAGGLLAVGLIARLVRWMMEPSDKPGSNHGAHHEISELRTQLQERDQDLERLRSVIRLSGSLNATLNYDRVLDITLDLGQAALGEARGTSKRNVSALLLFEDDQLVIAHGRGFTHADKRLRLPGREGALARALAGSGAYTSDYPEDDPELKQLAGLHDCRCVVCIPIVVGLEVYGVLLFGHPSPGYFGDERVELLEAITQQAVVALQNAILYRTLEEDKERMQVIQEDARKKLARDLHDGPTQSVGAITMRLSYARSLVERDTSSAREELFKIEELARRTTKEIRQMLFALRPLILESEGLVPALEYLASQAMETYGQNVIIKADPEVAKGLELGKQNVLFHVAEEAISNARKHASARSVWVRAKNQGDLLILEVEDDGVGFDVKEVDRNYEQRGSMGILNLRERAELVNGKIEIDSGHGKGTCIRLIVPRTVEAADRLNSFVRAA